MPVLPSRDSLTEDEIEMLAPRNRNWMYVYVIESPREDEIASGICDSTALVAAAMPHCVPCVIRPVRNPSQFYHALTDELTSLLPHVDDDGNVTGGIRRFPFIHISAHGIIAHGCAAGIGFTNGEWIPWALLRDWLTGVLQHFVVLGGGRPMLSLSACQGFDAAATFMSQPPFPLAVIAPNGKPTWEETRGAYSVLYDYIARGEPLAAAISRMNQLTRSGLFAAVLAPDAPPAPESAR